MNIPAKVQQTWPSVLGGEVVEIVNMDEHKHGQWSTDYGPSQKLTNKLKL